NNKELQDYIFMDAVSTKEEASIFSGRGVGLSLLRKTLNELNGTITVDSGSWGTHFQIKVPRYFRM
ncbi:MAG: ATP-binding protein, partial [Bdellovibrio sp.]